MGFFTNAASAAVGYGFGRHHKNEKTAEEEINKIRNMTLREYLDAYRNANHIVLETNDADMFIRELQEIAHDYELGI